MNEIPLWKGKEKELQGFFYYYFLNFEYSYFLTEFYKTSSVI